MDGAAESENAGLFNDQEGEFVAGNDNLAAPQNAPGMTIKDRFLYRDFSGAGNFFSADINGGDTVVRGPSWWLLRDYANLYKRLKTSTIPMTQATFYTIHTNLQLGLIFRTGPLPKTSSISIPFRGHGLELTMKSAVHTDLSEPVTLLCCWQSMASSA